MYELIEVPGLPEGFTGHNLAGHDGAVFTDLQMREYAVVAVLADRQRREGAAGGIGVRGMSLRDAMAQSVKFPDELSIKWGEALAGELIDGDDVCAVIDWWARVEAAYRYKVADAMLAARAAGGKG